MKLYISCALTIVFVAVLSVGADARSHRSGGTYGFATSHCKRSSCFDKHPSGTYVHPLTYRRHH
jgi:YHS domain-containing protein